MRFLSGAEATRVYAEIGTLFHPELTVDDMAVLLVTFEDDIAASVDPSWSIPITNPFHYDFFLRILGSEGVIELDETKQSLQITRASEGDRSFVLESFGPDVELAMLRHFVQCIRSGGFAPPAASGADGLRTLEIALAAYESARRGQPVPILEPAGLV